MTRLSYASLAALPAAIARPAYDRAALSNGIVHLGVGAFHRAHQAVMTEAVLASGDLRWGIVAASLRSPDTRDALQPQDGLYTVAVRDAGGERLQVVGAIRRVLVGPEDPAALIAAMAAPSVKIVTLTVTEKGYCHDPATGALNEQHPDIVHDLADMTRPRSAPGYLLAALAKRRAAGVPPFTVVCCDNLPSNGRTVHRVLSRMASLLEPAFGAYVREKLACPCTMVDRIVPATTNADRADIGARLGVTDAWPVVTEPFTQWVIEDRFPEGRPDWALAGAQFVADVAPFELMKLRLLNGAHSSLAYLGLALGHETVTQAANDPRLSRFLEGLWTEVRPTVPAPQGVDLAAYCADLLARFRNPTIKHRLAQIAMDGSQKLPQRLLGSWRETLAAGRPAPHIALAVAAFAAHASGRDADGAPITVQDPLAAELAHRLDGWRTDPASATERLLGLRALFAPDLASHAGVGPALSGALTRLAHEGPASALA
jgi:fructuronate reductase